MTRAEVTRWAGESGSPLLRWYRKERVAVLVRVSRDVAPGIFRDGEATALGQYPTAGIINSLPGPIVSNIAVSTRTHH